MAGIDPPVRKVNYRKAFDAAIQQRLKSGMTADLLQSPLDPTLGARAVQNTQTTPTAPAKTPVNWAAITAGANGAIPYLSNAINAFRRPPMPASPTPYNPIHLRRVNFGAAKTEADREVAGQNQGLYYMPENQRAAVQTANMIQGLRAKGMYTMQEQNANAQIGNEEAVRNGQIDMANVNNTNNFKDQQVEREMAIGNASAANLANASDKFIGIQNQKGLMNLEAAKYGLLQEAYAPSGVARRLDARLAIDPVTGQPRRDGMRKYSAGGMMRVYGEGGELVGGPGDTPPAEAPNPRYASGARLAYYKEQLNQRLREKDPQGYDKFFQDRVNILRSGDRKALDAYDQGASFNAYLSPTEVKQSLGDQYDDYLNSIRQASKYIPGQQYKQLYGTVEGDLDPSKLNYGRRFATLSTLTAQDDHTAGVRTDYSYTPKTGVKVVRSRLTR